MRFQRSSGVLLHPTSLPGPYGAGDLGPEAFSFLEFLAAAGQTIWQVLPLNPTGYADSPYQCFSAFAGNPLLISLDRLAEQGLLSADDLADVPELPTTSIDYGAVIAFRFAKLRKAAARFFAEVGGGQDCGDPTFRQKTAGCGPPSDPEMWATLKAEFEQFCAEQAAWLGDYALFMAAKDAHDGIAWTGWEPALAAREPEALARWSERLAGEIAAYKFWQFEFFRQWGALREACHQRGIRIMGDLPIYVAHDSADVWTAPELFWLDGRGNPLKVSGVPPDYFSATGQLWGNPTYRWDRLRKDGFRWWIERVRGVMRLFDMVRIDHFRGFEAYFEIPAGETTAVHGVWIKGPGVELFEALEREFGALPIVAENLGVITPEVEAIRKRFDFPGMALLQFAFGNDPQGPSFRPHNYERNLVAYTGGHDNDTTVGWWTSGIADSTRSEEDLQRERAFAGKYLNMRGEEIQWAMIRALMASVADTVLIPMQDVLGLGSQARMNRPGRMDGNWRWRYERGELRPEMAQRLRVLTELYER